MSIGKRIAALLLAVITVACTMAPSVFAKEFAPVIDTNIGVNTQYAYDENDPSWLRQLTIKEDMLSTSGIINALVLHPLAEYPYITDASTFKKTVEENVRIYTLDEDSRRAAYLLLIEQIGALSIISDPSATDESKADWLRSQGIIITEEEEADPEKVLMISALYALMKNDFYYVIKGERITIPQGSTLEEAMVLYLTSFSDQEGTLMPFIKKFFKITTIASLEDYIYYTSLMTLYTRGYVSPLEITSLSREDVYRRTAIMTISAYGIAIDSETATTEEIQQKYLTAMLGTQYKLTLDPTALVKAQKKKKIPYYLLQKMAYEDANLTISQTQYDYKACFELVCQKTQRFDLEDEFYSDIYEYDVHLGSKRKDISICPTPINSSGVKIYVNDTEMPADSYTEVKLNGQAKETLELVCEYVSGKTKKTTTYKINVHQGTSAAPDSDLTGIVPTIGNIFNSTISPSETIALPPLMTVVDKINNAAGNLVTGILSFNDKGQLVDQNGNVVSNNSYEQLPDNYKYVLGEDGVISIVLITDVTTEPTTEDGGELDKKDIKKIVIIVAGVSLALLAILALVIFKLTGGKKSEAEKMKKRRAKEKAKKAKKEGFK